VGKSDSVIPRDEIAGIPWLDVFCRVAVRSAPSIGTPRVRRRAGAWPAVPAVSRLGADIDAGRSVCFGTSQAGANHSNEKTAGVLLEL
jgi:hypothetical protein